jgi:hypothetical protein
MSFRTNLDSGSDSIVLYRAAMRGRKDWAERPTLSTEQILILVLFTDLDQMCFDKRSLRAAFVQLFFPL